MTLPSTADTTITAKPGWTTTEFWTTIGTNVVALIVAFATMSNNKINSAGAQALVPGLATLAAAIATGYYSYSRSKVKAAVHTANASMVTAQIAASQPSIISSPGASPGPGGPAPRQAPAATTGSSASNLQEDPWQTTVIERGNPPYPGG
jgi:hypothetical protein